MTSQGSTTYSDSESADDFQVQIQDFEHFYMPKQSKQHRYHIHKSSSLLYTHQTENNFYSPIQPYLPLHDDPTHPLYYLNIPCTSPSTDLHLPFPTLIIRPIAPKYTQGLTPSGVHGKVRAIEQADYYKEYEENFAAVVTIYAQQLISILDDYYYLKNELESVQLQPKTLSELQIDIDKLPKNVNIINFLQKNINNLQNFEFQNTSKLSVYTTPQLLDFDEPTDETSTLFHSISTPNSNGITINGKSIPYSLRKFTTFHTIKLLLALFDERYTLTHKRQQKTSLKPLGDDPGECKICLQNYKNYDKHIELESHKSKYISNFHSKLSKFSLFNDISCYDFVMQQAEKTRRLAQLGQQMHVLAHEFAIRNSISYRFSTLIFTKILFKFGVEMIISEVENVIINEIENEVLEQFVSEQRVLREKMINEAEVEEIEAITCVLDAIKPGLFGLDLYEIMRSNDVTMTQEFYNMQYYPEHIIQKHANFVNFVESYLQREVIQQIYEYKLLNLIDELKKFDIDQIGPEVVKLAGNVKYCLFQAGYMGLINSNNGFIRDFDFAQLNESTAEPFIVRDKDCICSIPTLQAVFEQQTFDLNNIDDILELGIEDQTKNQFIDDSIDFRKAPQIYRSNSVSCFPVQLDSDQISMQKLYVPVQLQTHSIEVNNKQLILESACQDALISLQPDFGLKFTDAVLICLWAEYELRKEQQGYLSGQISSINKSKTVNRMMSGK